MFEDLVHIISGTPWTYALVLGIAAGDVLFPLLPSETVVITAAVVATRGDLSLVAVILAAAGGALLGDNLAYLLGRRVGGRLAWWLFRGETGRRRLRSAEAAVKRRGPALIVVGRFVPGGRTASTFAAGTVAVSYRRFLPADLAAALAWALYASLLGVVGGVSFQHSAWKSLVLSLGLAAVIAVAAEGGRRLWRRRRSANESGVSEG